LVDWDSVSGYPLTLFKDSNAATPYLCKICSKVCRDPVKITCKTAEVTCLFCKSCFEASAEPCPLCMTETGSTREVGTNKKKHKLKQEEITTEKIEIGKLMTNCPFKCQKNRESDNSSDTIEYRCEYKKHITKT